MSYNRDDLLEDWPNTMDSINTKDLDPSHTSTTLGFLRPFRHLQSARRRNSEPVSSREHASNKSQADELLEDWPKHPSYDSIDTDTNDTDKPASSTTCGILKPARYQPTRRCNSQPIPRSELLEDWPRHSSCDPIGTNDPLSVSFSERAVLLVYMPDSLYVRKESYNKKDRKQFQHDALSEAVTINRLAASKSEPSAQDSLAHVVVQQQQSNPVGPRLKRSPYLVTICTSSSRNEIWKEFNINVDKNNCNYDHQEEGGICMEDDAAMEDATYAPGQVRLSSNNHSFGSSTPPQCVSDNNQACNSNKNCSESELLEDLMITRRAKAHHRGSPRSSGISIRSLAMGGAGAHRSLTVGAGLAYGRIPDYLLKNSILSIEEVVGTKYIAFRKSPSKLAKEHQDHVKAVVLEHGRQRMGKTHEDPTVKLGECSTSISIESAIRARAA